MTSILRGTELGVHDPDYVRHLAALEARWNGLPDKPEETPASTIQALWLTAAADPCSAALASIRLLPDLDAEGRVALNELVERRLAGVPLAHLTGRQHFMELELLTGPEALIPRRETELLGRAALEVLRATVVERGSALVLDVCTGSGNLALALAHHESSCNVIGGDLSETAIELAQRNAERLGLADRVRFLQGDLFSPFETVGLRGAADLVVCNPPYISTSRAAGMAIEIAQFEPRLAFDGGPFGISILFRLVAEAPRFLKPASWLCFEVGAGQGEPMAVRLERAGSFASVERIRDGAGEIRALVTRTQAAN
jgi:release factor glutamine methyltransferase